MDKSRDSGEVARLVSQLREVIAYYQVSENHFVGPRATHRS